MDPKARKYVWDAVQAAQKITRFTQGKTFESYQSDELLRSAVERQLEIIGEALAQMRRLDASAGAAIPELSRIIAFRNILVHGYASVDDKLVWGVVEGKLAPLAAALNDLLSRS